MAVRWMMFLTGLILVMVQRFMLHSQKNVNLEVLVDQPTYACADGLVSRFADFPFCNVSLSIKDRVEDIVGRLSLSEKIQLLVSDAAGVPRLGLPPYQWWQEALHGVAISPGVRFVPPIPAATSFPQVILTAASFNATLWKEIGKAVSTEARAMYNFGLSGLTFWSPNINIFRDPRWGRGQETPGEDPLVAGTYATHFVKGLQESGSKGAHKMKLNVMSSKAANETVPSYLGPKQLKVSACCKHFTAYDMEKSGGTDCFHFNAQVTLQDLEDTYNPPFRACVQDGGVSCVMCSYNRLNGVPTCADYNLLTKTIRQAWAFDGYIVSDCDAVAIIHDYVNYAPTPEDAVSEVLKAGLNLNCGTYIARHAQKALEEGKISQADVDKAFSKLVSVQMRLGLFDGNPKSQQYGLLGPEAVCTEEHQLLALEAAREGIVLLKNEGQTLPFSNTTVQTLAVIGPHGNASDAMLGSYAGIPCRFITPIQGLQAYGTVLFVPGCLKVSCEEVQFLDAALEVVERADAVVLIVGLNEDQEREGHDRQSLILPGEQEELVTTAAAAAAAKHLPVILVTMCGGPIDLSFAKDNANISSILWIGYPGEAGGLALAQTLYGEYNPGGRLPVTWYPQEFVEVSMLNMHMRPNQSSGYPGRTYRFYTGKTVYNFGYGKSFTTFSSSFVSAPGTVGSKSLIKRPTSPQAFLNELDVEDAHCGSFNFDITLNITNTGFREGSHVVLLYSEPPAGLWGSPKRFLVAFDRIHLKAKESMIVVFGIVPCRDLALVQNEGKKVLYTGSYTLMVDEARHSFLLNFDSFNT